MHCKTRGRACIHTSPAVKIAALVLFPQRPCETVRTQQRRSATQCYSQSGTSTWLQKCPSLHKLPVIRLQDRPQEVRMAKKLVTAQKRGETRAICLGLGMVACSVFMYFFIGVTIVPLYQRSVWTKESVCKLMKASLEKKVQFPFSEGFGDENTFHYPCLKVQVNLTRLGKLVMLHHTEDTVYRNPKV
ncbi:putative calcium-activated potassium channel subunit beta [Varanus komodoensis]|nr:putative calcium-activated potassium channel subunit beta [Varanus komodoensis]